MKRVVVKKGKFYYQCLSKDSYKYKCGKCLFGIIFAAIRPTEIPNICKRCGAKHYSTTWGEDEMRLRVFHSNYD